MARNLIVINVDFKETRVALIEDGVIAELQIERAAHRSTVGNVVLGRVTRVLPGMQAAFIDVGQERAAFLHVEDLIRPNDFDAYLASDAREKVKLKSADDSGGEAQADGDEPPTTEGALPAEALEAGGRAARRGRRRRGRRGRGRERLPATTSSPLAGSGDADGAAAEGDDEADDSGPQSSATVAFHGATSAEGAEDFDERGDDDDVDYQDERSGIFDDIEFGEAREDADFEDVEVVDADDSEELEFGEVDEDEGDDDESVFGPDVDDVDVEADEDGDVEDDDELDADHDFEVDEDSEDDESDEDDADDSDDEDDAPESESDATGTTETSVVVPAMPRIEMVAESEHSADRPSHVQLVPPVAGDDEPPSSGERQTIDEGSAFGEGVAAAEQGSPAEQGPAIDGGWSGDEGSSGDESGDADAPEVGVEASEGEPGFATDDESDEGDDETAAGGVATPEAAGEGRRRRGRRRRRRGNKDAAPAAAAAPAVAPVEVEAVAVAAAPAADSDAGRRGGGGRRRRGRRRGGSSSGGRPETKATPEVVTTAIASDTSRRMPLRVSRSVPITEVVKEGDQVVVQISKEPIGTKGARVTSHVSLPGRYVVYLPTVDHVGISKRIGNARERARLRKSIEAIKPANGGLIVRTVAEGLTKKQLKADIGYLIKVWADVAKRRESAKSAEILYEELDLVLKAARDLFTDEVQQIVIDDREQHGRLCRFVEMFMPGRVKDIKLYSGDEPIFDAYGIEDEIKRALSRKVPLPSGGSLIMDQAEALTAIDVNTGRYVGKGSKDLEETALKTNLEAVDEIAYQLRFRNIGGLVILDLIDMEKADNREKVWRALEQKLAKDKAKTTINRISDLGLIEMTRKRTRESLGRIMHEPCFYCDGTGNIQSRETIAYEILRQIRRDRMNLTGYSVRVVAHPAVVDFLKHEARDALQDAERRYMRRIELVPRQEYHIEQYDLTGR